MIYIYHIINLTNAAYRFMKQRTYLCNCDFIVLLGKNNKYIDELIVPIVEGQPEEIDLAVSKIHV